MAIVEANSIIKKITDTLVEKYYPVKIIQMLEICIRYFAGKKENTKDLNNGYRRIPCSKQIRKMITEDCE